MRACSYGAMPVVGHRIYPVIALYDSSADRMIVGRTWAELILAIPETPRFCYFLTIS